MNDIHEMLRISSKDPSSNGPISNSPISNSPSSNDPNNWNKNKGLTLGNFKTGGKLISVVQPIQARTTLFSFSKKGCCIVQGFFNLTIIEIIVPNGLRFSQLTIQPLRQGHPPQNVAHWFTDMFYFRSVIVDNRFKKNSQNLLDIIKKTIHYGLNLSEFAGELVPIEFDITMHTNSPWPDSSEDDDCLGREINPLRCDIKLSPLHVQRKRTLLCIEDGEKVEVFDERNEEPDPKRR